MKFRNGFVSNSSSSSFIVNFDNKIKTKEDLQKELFDNLNRKEFVLEDGEIYDAEDISNFLFKNMKKCNINRLHYSLHHQDFNWGKFSKESKENYDNWFLKKSPFEFLSHYLIKESKKKYKLPNYKNLYQFEIDDHSKIGSDIVCENPFDRYLIRTIYP